MLVAVEAVLVAGPTVLKQQTSAWWVERLCRIVIDIVFFMLGAAQRVFDVRASELMCRATLLRCGSSRLSFIMLLSWVECGALSPPAAGTPLTEHKVWLSWITWLSAPTLAQPTGGTSCLQVCVPAALLPASWPRSLFSCDALR